MGLDQYAYSEDSNGERTEIAYWRKHNRLQGWMENLYTDKGGMEEFNTVDLELTLEDLDVLESTMMNKLLPETGGFFYGNDSYEDYESEEYGYKSDDEMFINKAREELNKGNKVIYFCWW
jgi:hypothetical protein